MVIRKKFQNETKVYIIKKLWSNCTVVLNRLVAVHRRIIKQTSVIVQMVAFGGRREGSMSTKCVIWGRGWGWY